MILETMNFVCHHPSEYTGAFFSYSFRHYPRNEDASYKDKALKILSNIEYSEIKNTRKQDFKTGCEKELDKLIEYLTQGFISI